MAWNVVFNPSTRIVEATYEGVVSTSELHAGCATTLDLCRDEHTPLVLADCSRLESGFSIVDLYDLAQSVATIPAFREAVLVPSDSEAVESVKFWETTASNRGVMVRLFTDRDQAVRWLQT